MNEFRADLHCHSTSSDGTVSPEDLVKLAKKNGLSGLSITDHDTTDAYSEALPIAKELELELISGVEFSATHNDTSVHILGYSFDLKSDAIKKLCGTHKKRREERNRAILDKLAVKGLPIDYGRVANIAGGTIGRPHIAQVMVELGYVETIKDAFKKYIGSGKPCFAKTNHITAVETIETIHKAGGFSIIAHPHLIQDQKLLCDLLKMDFDGLECYYAKFTPSKEKRWVKIAKNRNWLATGGSDFHGEVKPHLPLGCSYVGIDTFSILKERFIENNPRKNR